MRVLAGPVREVGDRRRVRAIVPPSAVCGVDIPDVAGRPDVEQRDAGTGIRERLRCRNAPERVDVLAVAGVGITIGLAKLKPAAPGVEMSTLWPDTVRRGPMLREVRGLGTLVPEDTMLITARTDGRVERILIRPGTPVRAFFPGRALHFR